jgi:hypothetical protein
VTNKQFSQLKNAAYSIRDEICLNLFLFEAYRPWRGGTVVGLDYIICFLNLFIDVECQIEQYCVISLVYCIIIIIPDPDL